MKPILVSFDGHNINDGTNYIGKIPLQSPLQATQAKTNYVKRAGATPVYAGKELPESYLTITIICRGTVNDQLEELNKWFNVYDETPKVLIIKDTDDSDKQYQAYATPRAVSPLVGASAVKITLARKDPIWRAVTQTSTPFTITASGDNVSITNNGNIETYPYIEFTPTSYPSAGYGKSKKVSFIPNSLYAWPNRPVEVLGGLDTAALVADTSVSNQVASNIDDAVTTIPIDTAVGGGLGASGYGYVGTEQISWTGNSGGNLTGVTRGVGGTTPAAHLDNAVIARSIVLANGNDFRVVVDGNEVPRWFGETSTAQFNQTATKCWIVLDVPAKQQTTLKTAIANTGTPATIAINYTAANKTALLAMPPSGRVLIDSEEFTYSAKTITLTVLSLTVNARTCRNTSIAAHSVNATIKWIPYDIQIAYSNFDAGTPDQDETEKPIINMATSTNASFVYANFIDTSDPMGLRAGSWKPTLVKTAGGLATESQYYFGTNFGADTNPAEVMGMKISTFISAGVQKAETATVRWVGSFPDAVSNVDSNGSKYRATAKWCTVARLYSSILGTTSWTAEWAATEATPASVTTWTTWTHNTESVVNTNKFLKFEFIGTTTATAGDYFCFEVTDVTVTLVNYPTVALRAEESNYYIDATLTNTTTGEYINIKYPLQTNQMLIIDTDPNNPYAKFGGQVIGAIKPDTNRSNWLKMIPGENIITFTSASNSDITATIKHYDRMNFI